MIRSKFHKIFKISTNSKWPKNFKMCFFRSADFISEIKLFRIWEFLTRGLGIFSFIGIFIPRIVFFTNLGIFIQGIGNFSIFSRQMTFLDPRTSRFFENSGFSPYNRGKILLKLPRLGFQEFLFFGIFIFLNFYFFGIFFHDKI